MRGLLSFMILCLLSRRPMYGQELADEIARRRGQKPNPGTLYPALKDLRRRGVIDVKAEGRKTVYELTPAGRRGVGVAVRYFRRAFGEIVPARVSS